MKEIRIYKLTERSLRIWSGDENGKLVMTTTVTPGKGAQSHADWPETAREHLIKEGFSIDDNTITSQP